MADPIEIHRIDGDHRVIIHRTKAWVVDNEGTKLTRDHVRHLGEEDAVWVSRAKLWAREIATFLSPGN